MQDLDFEQIRGFEPTTVMPFRPLGKQSDLSCDDPAIRVAAQSQHLDDLMRLMNLPESKEPRADRVSIPLRAKPRQYTRLPVSTMDSIAEFRVLGRRYDCRLQEMSIGGFGIYLPRLLSVHPGTLAHLYAPGLNYVVSVSRIEPKGEHYRPTNSSRVRRRVIE